MNLRLAPYPAQELPLPEAPLAWNYEITPAGCIVAVTPPDPNGPRAYHEAYLQLFALDLSSRAEITRFLNKNGPLSIPDETRGPLGFDWHRGFTAVERELKIAGNDIGLEIADWDLQAGSRRHFMYVQPLSEFIWQATCLRDLIRAWRWFKEGVAVSPGEWESSVWAHDDAEWSIPTSPEAAAALLRQGLRSGMRPFHPELRIAAADDDPRWTTSYGGGVAFYYICCLELFNLIVRDTALAHCANERCQRLFSRQGGRSQKGTHRSIGVRFCSMSCARAQAQRDYRRRRAARA